MLEDGFFDPEKPFQIRRSALPHWRQDGALYFVTFRLCDSLSRARLDAWRRDGDDWQRTHPDASSTEIEDFFLAQRRRLEKWLDAGSGSCILSLPEAKSVVEGALRHFNGSRYELGETAVAANHTHAIVRTASGVDLSDVLHSWKRHSSRRLAKLDQVRNVAPHLLGQLWQTESFDHIVRNRASLEKFSLYIRNHRA
ncbi:MAG TPA: transposase [Thermoanaerobaculia bacterium]|nr:transposase [Thermoanaerobaculia bacterium]